MTGWRSNNRNDDGRIKKSLQSFNDCVLRVFQNITGEVDDRVLARFFPFFDGGRGVSLDAVIRCLRDAGYRLRPHEEACMTAGVDRGAFYDLCRKIEYPAVVFYGEPAHAVLVKVGGTVVDSARFEEETVEAYFGGIGELRIRFFGLAVHTTPKPEEPTPRPES